MPLLFEDQEVDAVSSAVLMEDDTFITVIGSVGAGRVEILVEVEGTYFVKHSVTPADTDRCFLLRHTGLNMKVQLTGSNEDTSVTVAYSYNVLELTYLIDDAGLFLIDDEGLLLVEEL